MTGKQLKPVATRLARWLHNAASNGCAEQPVAVNNRRLTHATDP